LSIQWMEEILHHLWWWKPKKQWDKPSTVSSGAGFLPSAVPWNLLTTLETKMYQQRNLLQVCAKSLHENDR
jgi:hypothetical protein